MVVETFCKKIADRILKVAINSVDSTCIYWHHQPKVPDSIRKNEEAKTIYKNK